MRRHPEDGESCAGFAVVAVAPAYGYPDCRHTAPRAPPPMHPCAPYAGPIPLIPRSRDARNPRWRRELSSSWKRPSQARARIRNPRRSPSSAANSCWTAPCGTRRSGTGTCSPAPGWRRTEGVERCSCGDTGVPAPGRAPGPAGLGDAGDRQRGRSPPPVVQAAPVVDPAAHRAHLRRASTYRSRPGSWRSPAWSGWSSRSARSPAPRTAGCCSSSCRAPRRQGPRSGTEAGLAAGLDRPGHARRGRLRGGAADPDRRLRARCSGPAAPPPPTAGCRTPRS